MSTGKRILVAGIGNRLMGDDGFGPRVIDNLESMDLPDYVEVLDVGTAGITIATELSDYNFVIFLDTMNMEGDFGKIYESRLEVKEGIDDVSDIAKTTLHEVGPEGLLRFSKTIGTLPPKVVLIGCKPKNVTVSLDLSPEVEESTFIAANMVLNLIEKEKKLGFLISGI
jgi:hydrogenase maturation protease